MEDVITKDPPPPRSGLHGWLDRIRSTRTGTITLRVVLTLLGVAVVVGGLALVPLPGPGWAIVVGGLAILALEYAWAHHLLAFTKRTLTAWLHWVGRQPLLVRFAIAVVGLLFIAAVLWFSLRSVVGFDYVTWGLGLVR